MPQAPAPDKKSPTPDVSIAAGADGCRKGWLCIRRKLASPGVSAQLFTDAAQLVAQRPRPAALAIDVPIGLTDAGARECDRRARALLGRPRASSVFPAPVRPALGARTREDAARITRRADGRSVGAQAWGIYPKITEVDCLIGEDPGLQAWVREAHPEVCFFAWNGGRAMRWSKRTRPGREERRARVDAHFGPEAFEAVRAAFAVRDVAHDDILDAFATLWTAERICLGAECRVPEHPPVDAAGLRMEIVY